MSIDTPQLGLETLGGGDTSRQLNIGRWTFEVRKVRWAVESRLYGRVLNACCGKTRLRHPENGVIHRNDINPEIDADTHYDVTTIDEHFRDRHFDVVVFDPPYDQSQSDEHYDGMHASDIQAARRSLATLTAPDGKLIEFRWNSVSVSQLSDIKGWRKEEVVLWQRGMNLHEVIMTVDRRVAGSLDGFTSSDEVGEGPPPADE